MKGHRLDVCMKHFLCVDLFLGIFWGLGMTSGFLQMFFCVFTLLDLCKTMVHNCEIVRL